MSTAAHTWTRHFTFSMMDARSTEIPLASCVGPAVLIDLRHLAARDEVRASHLLDQREVLQETKRAVIRTGWSAQWAHPRYFTDYPVISGEAAELLVSLGVILVGIDTPSVDDPPFPAHLALLGGGLVIVENLTNLDRIPTGTVSSDSCSTQDLQPRRFACESLRPIELTMPTLQASDLTDFAAAIFAASGTASTEAQIVADSLVAANLVGHDSHGVMRIPEYIAWVEQGSVNLAAKPRIDRSTDSFAVLDGDWGWGQVVGRQAVDLAADNAAGGVGTIFCRNSCHIGRAGEYPEMLARRGLVSVMFVNTHGAGRLVAPFGGIERRLSANPICVGIPRGTEEPIVVDLSTCAIAEGKLRNMRAMDQPVPAGCIVDANGLESTNAADFYGPPPGALLPVGGHKGFALGLAADILAGALSGAGCSRPGATRIGNSFMLVAIDVAAVRGTEDFTRDVLDLVEFVKSSQLAEGFAEILVPGEPEARVREKRRRDGIPVHEAIWNSVTDVANRYGVKPLRS